MPIFDNIEYLSLSASLSLTDFYPNTFALRANWEAPNHGFWCFLHQNKTSMSCGDGSIETRQKDGLNSS